MRGGAGPTRGSLPATVTLTVVSLASGAGLDQLFQGPRYLLPVLAAILAAHAVSWALRRSRAPALVGAAVSALAILAVAVWLVFPGSTTFGLPGPSSWHAVATALTQARVDFRSMSAPVPLTSGFLFLAVVGMGTVSALADSTAFRVGTAIEGILPTFAVFIFTAGLGAPAGRAVAVATWLGAVLAFLLVTEVESRSGAQTWFSGDARSSRRPPARSRAALLGAGASLAAVAVLGASLVGPALPGAGAASLVDWHGGSGLGAARRTTISPLVDIRQQLLQPSDVEAFTVAAPRPSYWRLTSLDTFDGTVWSSDDAYGQVGSQLPGLNGPEQATTVDQRYTIHSLSSVWLPAAYLPVAVSGLAHASFSSRSASLITSRSTSRGLTYRVASQVPDFSPAELSQAQVDRAPALARDLSLPSSVPARVAALAHQVVLGQTTAYGKALALQDFFRHNFTYSLAVAPSNSDNALVQFLFDTRKGYCQQFAGAYAVMAREVGLPTRVAIGFTPGQLRGDGLYHVLALDAHAWPEVNLGRYGWVAFEPTPGRGEPGASAYTHVAAQQARPGGGPAPAPVATTAPTAASAPTSTVPARGARRARAPQATRVQAGGHRAVGVHLSSKSLAGAVLGALGLAVLALAIPFGLVPALVSARRRRHRARAGGGKAGAALVAFVEAAGELARWGRPRHGAETLAHYARRVAPALAPAAGMALVELVQCAQEAAYAPSAGDGDGDGTSADLYRLVDEIRRALRREAPWVQRLWWWVDPRPLWSMARLPADPSPGLSPRLSASRAPGLSAGISPSSDVEQGPSLPPAPLSTAGRGRRS